MKPLLRYILPAVLLISAFAAGYAVRGFSMHRRMHKPHHAMGPRFIEKLQEKLDLSAEQSQQIRVILEKQHGEAMRLRKESRPRFKAIQEEAQKEIFSVLNEEQKITFREMIKRHKKRRKQWRDRRREQWKKRHQEEFQAPPPPPH